MDSTGFVNLATHTWSPSLKKDNDSASDPAVISFSRQSILLVNFINHGGLVSTCIGSHEGIRGRFIVAMDQRNCLAADKLERGISVPSDFLITSLI